MTILNIVAGINAKLAGETLTFEQMRIFLDEVIDDINTSLGAKFPSFDDLTTSDSYTAIPDKYIRSVVFSGVASKFYITDEEGIVTATQYVYDYKDRLFFMQRDYINDVPEEYQDIDHGYITNGGDTSLFWNDGYSLFGGF